MKRHILTTLVALVALAPAGLLAQGQVGGGGQVSGAGGTYTGPEDIVPGFGVNPKPGNSSGGNQPEPGAAAPTPGVIAPRGLVGGGSRGNGGAGIPLTAATQSVATGVDWSAWELWWNYNQHDYLDLRSHMFGDSVLTGSDDFFLGHGEAQFKSGTTRPTPTGMQAEVLPLMLETLRAQDSTTMEAETLLALGKLASFTGDTEAALQAIKPFLTHGNQAVRERAVAALGILGREQSIDLIASLASGDTKRLRDEYWITFGDKVPYRTRAFATYALGLIGEASGDYHRIRVVGALTGPAFQDALGMPTPDVAVAAVLSLARVPLPLAAGDTDGPGKLTLRLTTRQHQVRWLLALFDDRDTPREVRSQVPGVIASLLEDAPADSALRRAAIKRMVEALEDRNSVHEVRRGAAIALGQLADSDEDRLDEDAREALQHAAEKDSDQVVRRFATIALAEAAGRPGSGKGESTAGVRDARRYLSRNLGRGTSQTRPWSGLALGILERSLQDHGLEHSSDSQEALRNAFKRARSPSESGAMALACGLARDVGAEEALREKLASGADRTTRSYAALALGLSGAQGARGDLAEELAKSRFQPVMLSACAIGLTLLDDDQVVPLLLAELDRSSSVSSQGPVAAVLGRVGDSRAIGPLTALATSDEATQLARASALTALGQLAQRHLLPWNALLGERVNYTSNPLTLTAPLLGGGILDLP